MSNKGFNGGIVLGPTGPRIHSAPVTKLSSELQSKVANAGDQTRDKTASFWFGLLGLDPCLFCGAVYSQSQIANGPRATNASCILRSIKMVCCRSTVQIHVSEWTKVEPSLFVFMIWLATSSCSLTWIRLLLLVSLSKPGLPSSFWSNKTQIQEHHVFPETSWLLWIFHKLPIFPSHIEMKASNTKQWVVAACCVIKSFQWNTLWRTILLVVFLLMHFFWKQFCV